MKLFSTLSIGFPPVSSYSYLTWFTYGSNVEQEIFTGICPGFGVILLYQSISSSYRRQWSQNLTPGFYEPLSDKEVHFPLIQCLSSKSISCIGGISPQLYIFQNKLFIIESGHLKQIQSHLDIFCLNHANWHNEINFQS